MDPLANPNPEVESERDAAPEKLTGRDWRDLLGWILVAALGTAIAFRYFFVAFPEAAMDMRISRDEAEEIAREFVHQYVDPVSADHPLVPYQNTRVFRVEEDANGGGPKVYLERELGLAEANTLMASDVSVWFWQVRYFKPLQQEEFRAHISPAGRVVGYFHVVEETRAGAKLEQGAARVIAEQFARDRVRAPLGDYDFLPEEANSTEKPNRRDWKFTWERRGFKAKDAPYQIEVMLHGDRVGGYREFLKVPETWSRDYARLRSTNTFYQIAAQIPYMFLLGAVILVLVELGKKRLAPWGGAVRFGLVLATLYFLMSVNQWPITRAGYDTNSSYSGFALTQMSGAVLISLVLGMLTAFSAAAGEPLYRLLKPQSLQLGALFRRSTWFATLRSKEFFKATVIGLAMAGAHIGFVAAFYLAGRSVGFWSPQEIRYTDAVSTYAPWIFPLAISVFAAASEEFLFRLFAIPLLLRVTKSKVIAIVLPAFIWGFLHSVYPQQPGYVRGIEVGIIGVVAGWVMLRWGIWATLVWHYTVDALLIGLFLLRSESAYFKLSGGVVIALAVFPLLAALAIFVVYRRFATGEGVLNRALPCVPAAEEPEAVTVPETAADEEGLSARARMMFCTAGMVCLLLFVAAPKREAIGDFVRFAITPSEARGRADEVLRARKVHPAAYQGVASVVNNFQGETVEFLRRELGVPLTNELFRERVPAAFWSVRYFQDSQKAEYRVILLPDGAFHAIHHPLDERTEGPNLTKEEAQARGEAWLREEKKVDLTKWRLVEANSEKKPKRTDHHLVWEETTLINHLSLPVEKERAAYVRMELRVQGDEVSGYRKSVKLPEEWLRKHREDTLPKTAFSVARIALLAGLVVWMVVIFFSNLRKPEVPWSRISRWGLWAALAILVNVVNNFSQILANYTTEMSLKMFYALTVISVFFTVAVVYGGIFLLLAFAWFFCARAFGEGRMTGWRGMPPGYYRDAMWITVCGASIVLVLFGRLPDWADYLLPTWKQSVDVGFPGGLNSVLPAAAELASAVTRGFVAAGLVGLCAGFLGQWKHNRAVQAGFFLLATLTLTGSPVNVLDFAKEFAVTALQLGVIWFLVLRVLRFNLLGYFLLAAAPPLVSASLELARQPTFFYKVNAAICAAGVLLLFVLAVHLSRTAKPAPS